MGIQGFLPFLKNTYRDSVTIEIPNIDNLYIDINHILHHVCYLSKDTDDLIQRTQDYLFGIIKSIKPKKRVIMSADGPAPMAKMIVQRRRRLDTSKKGTNDLTLNLTSGTEFMTNLEHHLNVFGIYIKKHFNLDSIVSTTDSDEGEIKIKRQVIMYQKKYPNETHMICSGDSDMVLLLFTCVDLTKIYQMIDKNLIIDFGHLFESHKNKYANDNICDQNIKNDFVFLNLLMGNDYIPKVACLKIDDLWGSYKDILFGRDTGLITIQTKEDENVTDISTTNKVQLDMYFFNHLIHNLSKKIKPFMLKRYNSTDDKTFIKEYEKYSEGLYWCFTMYLTGRCVDYKYIFDYDFKPHLLGVMITMMFNNIYVVKKHHSIDNDLYGILLIPENAKTLLSKEQNLIIDKLSIIHPVIYEEERCNKCKKYYNKINILKPKNNQNDDDLSQDDMKQQYKQATRKYMTHKKTHTMLTYNLIDKIQTDFINIRNEVNEKYDIEYLHNYNESKEYKPTIANIILKKRLF